jgi:hypothetical protein
MLSHSDVMLCTALNTLLSRPVAMAPSFIENVVFYIDTREVTIGNKGG